jgi:hypothetical protein
MGLRERQGWFRLVIALTLQKDAQRDRRLVHHRSPDHMAVSKPSPQARVGSAFNGSSTIETRPSRVVAKHLDIFSEAFGDEIYQIWRCQIFRSISFVSVGKGRSGRDIKPLSENCEIALKGLKTEKQIHLRRDSVEFNIRAMDGMCSISRRNSPADQRGCRPTEIHLRGKKTRI